MSVVADGRVVAGQDMPAFVWRKLALRPFQWIRGLPRAHQLPPAYEYELGRQFAHIRILAASVLLIMAGSSAVMAGLWTSGVIATIWLLAMFVAQAAMVILSRWFLIAQPQTARNAVWRVRFGLGEASAGLGWAALGLHLATLPNDAAHVFALCLTILMAAMSTLLSVSLPIVMYVSAAPLAIVTVCSMAISGTIASFAMAVMAAGSLAYFMALGHRLRKAAIETLEFREGKEALIAELERAKQNSDEARQRAEEANLAKSRFLATMSHELRTPLNAIVGFSEVMQSEVFGPLNVPNYREYIGDIHQSGQHLLHVINEILDLSRIEAGRYELEEGPVNLEALVSECHHLLKLKAKAKAITVLEIFETGMPPIRADERAIRQVVLNLLSNAIKFTPQGGEITIKLGWTASDGQYLRIIDTGPGIPETEIPIVLTSFGRGSLAIKTAEQGTGLGLPIVKGLIDLHGGRFTLRSQPGGGTDVAMTLPAERVARLPKAMQKTSNDNSAPRMR